jgi:aspartyl/asparaginyl-tRNA synthetase
MEYDLESNLNPEFTDAMKIKIETVRGCIEVIESECKIKLQALELMKEDSDVRELTLIHYKDAIEAYSKSLTTLLQKVIDDYSDPKNDDTPPDLTI